MACVLIGFLGVAVAQRHSAPSNKGKPCKAALLIIDVQVSLQLRQVEPTSASPGRSCGKILTTRAAAHAAPLDPASRTASSLERR